MSGSEGVLLIVSAWLPEQRALREQCESVGGVEFLLTGIGPLRASACLAERLARQGAPAVSRLAFVGTAGAYDLSPYPLLSAWSVSRARFTDGAAAAGHSYFPASAQGAQFEEWTAQREQGAQSFHQEVEPVCVCPPSITRDVRTARALALLGALENLEVAGVAAACAARGVPWSAFLGVSNEVGPDAHSQWKAFHGEASDAAQALARERLGLLKV